MAGVARRTLRACRSASSIRERILAGKLDRGGEIWVAVGGRGTVVGAALGAVVVNFAKSYVTSGVLAP